jgi:hypothetical protein
MTTVLETEALNAVAYVEFLCETGKQFIRIRNNLNIKTDFNSPLIHETGTAQLVQLIKYFMELHGLLSGIQGPYPGPYSESNDISSHLPIPFL